MNSKDALAGAARLREAWMFIQPDFVQDWEYRFMPEYAQTWTELWEKYGREIMETLVCWGMFAFGLFLGWLIWG